MGAKWQPSLILILTAFPALSVSPYRSYLMLPPVLKKKIDWALDLVFRFISLLALALIIIRFGFSLEPVYLGLVLDCTELVLVLFLLQEGFRLFTRAVPWKAHLKARVLELIMAVLALQYFFTIDFLNIILESIIPNLKPDQISLTYLAFTQVMLIFFTTLGQAKKYHWFQKIQLDPGQIIIISFLIGSAIGTLLLKLPRATYDHITWIDAAFTATSSLCVTGLLPFNLADTFTPFGQFIIAILIQMGGLGIMTLTMVFLTLFPESLSVREKILLSEMVSEKKIGEVGTILKRIVLFTFIIELTGTVLLYFSVKGFSDPFDVRWLYHCLFHSISAFCNAGMTLFTASYDYMGVNGFTAIIAVLIMIGGIGFPILSELYNYLAYKLDWNKKNYRKHFFTVSSKLVIVTSLLLWFFGALTIGVLESNHTFAELPWLDKIFHSVFSSVTSRTAGFSTWPLIDMHGSSIIFLMILMWIGASPISTGGGIKTLNFALVLMSLKAHIQGKTEVSVFKRVISNASILRSFNIITLAMIFSALAMAVIFYLEPEKNVLHLAFEVVSALGTVGLSLELTSELGNPSKLLVIILMFVGRVGPYTLLLGIYKQKLKKNYKEITVDIHTY